MKKVLVLVLGFDNEPWHSIEMQGQRPTWVTNGPSDVPVYFYYGVTKGWNYWLSAGISKSLHKINPELRERYLRYVGPRYAMSASESGDRIDVDIPDFYGNICAKTLCALRHVLKNHSFDYLYRTNTCSYVHLPLLQKIAQSLPRKRCYAGWVDSVNNIKFVYGDGILMSRDVVEIACRDKNWNWDLMDDVALACSMERAGVLPKALSRLVLNSPEKINAVSPELWKTCFHVRCKSVENRMNDIETMLRVHEVYSKAPQIKC